jgi:hypothetical protein
MQQRPRNRETWSRAVGGGQWLKRSVNYSNKHAPHRREKPPRRELAPDLHPNRDL